MLPKQPNHEADYKYSISNNADAFNEVGCEEIEEAIRQYKEILDKSLSTSKKIKERHYKDLAQVLKDKFIITRR